MPHISRLAGDHVIVPVPIDQAARDGAPADGFDLFVIEVARPDDAVIEQIRALHERSPHQPIMVLMEKLDPGFALRAIEAGAQDCLVQQEAVGEVFDRAVRFAVERSRLSQRLSDAEDRDLQDRELGGLRALCGPAPVPVTERSFGVRSIGETSPDAFEELVVRYARLLDVALRNSAPGDSQDVDGALAAIADRLGMLGAGPRDVIELHKAAMTRCIDGQSARRARAYIEEGRLILLQLMGYLVTFYRAFSWGIGSERRLRTLSKGSASTPTVSKRDG